MVAVFWPKGSRRAASAVVCGIGFATALRLRDPRRRQEPARRGDRRRLDLPRPLGRDRADHHRRLRPRRGAHRLRRADARGEHRRVLRAARRRRRRDGFFVQASNLMTLFLGLEWFSIALYVMCAIDIDLVGSLEAGLKYLVIGAVGSATLLFGSALVYGATGQLSFDKIAAASDYPRLAARARPRDDDRRPRVQGLGRAVPHVDAGRLSGRAHAGHGVHVVGDEGGGARRDLPRARDGVPRRAASLDLGDRRDRDHLARRRQHRGARAAERQAAARLLVGLARRLHADRGSPPRTRPARRPSCTT